LPKLLIVTEGERHLVAIDLTSGEARWRFVWGNRGTLRLKRAGKLLYVASGDSALTAVDVTTGGVIWRVRDRLRFRTAPTMVHDTLYAVAGGLNCAANLHCIDAFSGHVRWTRAIEGPAPACTLEGPPLATGQAVTVALRDRHGLRLQGFDPTTGEQRWSSSQALAPVGTSWLAIDDLFVGNTPTGDLLGVDAANGFVRYKHSLGRTLETDMPRKLEPVLRCGALFVPSSDVHVVRPRDGISLGSIAPCEAIADLLRVDERCDVYVAEESGHLLSFSAGPRLSLVPSG
jgi:outer membrane protein assembly factor BamB